MWRLVTCLVCGFMLQFSQGTPANKRSGVYLIKTDETYVAYSGDLIVSYRTPAGVSLPNAFIMLVSLHPTVTEVTTIAMPIGLRSRQFRVKCGVIEHAGAFSFRMYMYAGGKVLTETRLRVFWSNIVAELPSNHVASTNSVPVTITSDSKCNSVYHRYPLHVHILYYPDLQLVNGETTIKPVFVSNGSLPVISNTKITQKYSCSTFDQAGYYQAVIISEYNASAIISKSNFMRTTWSTRYNISSYVKSVFPCERTLTILFSQPPCDDTTDKIRIYAIHSTVSGSKAAPQRYEYVTERPAYPGLRYDILKCEMFSRNTIGYCFYYISISLSGRVKEQKKYCLPTSPDSVLSEDGGWGAWSQWSVCTRTCGTGQQNRKRLCDQPVPYNNGKYCSGSPTQWRPCHNRCKDLISRLTPLNSAQVDQNCACGCQLTSLRGQVVATGHCHGLSLWPITLPVGRRIRLRFIYYDLDTQYQWVKVRDGRTRDANLLAFSAGASVLNDVVSSGNEMLIEFMTIPKKGVTRPQQGGHRVHGFIATYEDEQVSINSTIRPMDYAVWKDIDSPPPAWQSVMTIAGVIFCVLIVLTALAFVVYRRMHKEPKPNYKPADGLSSPPPELRSLSDNSPSNDNGGIPLTGEMKRKEIHRPRLSSVTSATSVRYALLGREQCDSTGGSPKPSTRHYSPLPNITSNSPDHAIAPDQIPDPKQWHSPPHGSTRGRKSSKNLGVSSKNDSTLKSSINRSPKPRTVANKSKTEILTDAVVENRYECDRLCDRVVTGASSTPTSQQQSSTGNTTEAVVNTQSGRKRRNRRDKRAEPILNARSPSRRKDESRSDRSRLSPKGKSVDVGKSLPMGRTVDFAIENKEKPLCRSKKSKKLKLHSASIKNESDQGFELSCAVVQKTPCSSDNANVKISSAARPISLFNQIPIGTQKCSPPTDRAEYEVYNVAGRDPIDVRDTSLPRPDGQSPECIREEKVRSRLSTPSGSITQSPTKTPDDDLEYDDFVLDDPHSYFDSAQTMMLRWQYLTGMARDVTDRGSPKVI